MESSLNPIEVAVAPLRNEAIAEARGRAERFIANLYRKLEENNWDLNMVAPYPKSNDADWREKRGLYYSANQIVESVKGCHRMGEPKYVRINPAREARFVEVACLAAASEYEAFVEKLVHKVGHVDSAELQGDRVWGRSELKVKKGDDVEYWLTQQILNYSSLGNPYNQWPTRKIKGSW